ncbi:MAG: restriction endonuclease [Thermincolia bacterium]
MNEVPKWKRFELLVKRIQEQLAPNATITHDDKVMGKKSGILRQIDISVRTKVGQYEIFVAVDCKDYNKPVDVKDVEMFAGLVDDVQANKGALISYKGFTEAARKIADHKGIDLYKLVDAESKDWPVYLSAPVICDLRGIKNYRIKIQSSYDAPLFIPNTDPRLISIYDEEKNLIGQIGELFKQKWNDGELEDTVGIHPYKLIKVYINYDGNFYPLDIIIEYEVTSRLFLGQVDILELQGLHDERTGAIHTKGITFDKIDFIDVEHDWKMIDSAEALATHPTMMIVALDTYK